jgi:Arc/MetJ-type ribon-helix-helix transcriptional regulator
MQLGTFWVACALCGLISPDVTENDRHGAGPYIPYRDAVWDAGGVTTQIAVRLPDEMVRFLDQSVASGKAPSRAALVAAALEREMRLQAAQQDAQTLKEKGTADDLDELVTWSVGQTTLEE